MHHYRKTILYMLKRFFHILIAVSLVFTTTASIWQHLLDHVDDPIELATENETDSEKNEKENKTETEGGDDHLNSELFDLTPQILQEQKFTTTYYLEPETKDADRLYILFQRLKVDC